MSDDLKRGDRVAWNTPQGTTTGKVVRKQTGRTQIKGHTVAASSDDPQFIVQSDKSGKQAAHKPEALHRRK